MHAASAVGPGRAAGPPRDAGKAEQAGHWNPRNRSLGPAKPHLFSGRVTGRRWLRLIAVANILPPHVLGQQADGFGEGAVAVPLLRELFSQGRATD